MDKTSIFNKYQCLITYIMPNFLLCFCIGIVLSFVLPIHIFPVWLLLLSAFFWGINRYAPIFIRTCFLSLICFLIGMSYGIWRTDLSIANRLSIYEKPYNQTITIKVNSLPEQSEYATRFEAKVLDKKSPKNILLSDYKQRDWHVGEVWQIRTRLIPPIGTVNPNGQNREAWALSHGIDAIGSVRSKRTLIKQAKFTLPSLRQMIHQRILHVGENYPQGTALIAALTVGKTYHLQPQDWQIFRHLGMNHLISISGLHIGMVALTTSVLILFVMRLWIKFFPISHYISPKIIAVSFSLIAAFIYALLAGMSIPTQRSFVMILSVCISLILRRFLSFWQIWQIALFSVLVFQPAAVLTIGFWLSFGLTFSLLWFSGSVIYNHKIKFLPLFIKAQLAVTLASIVPLSIFFSSFPVISPIANLFAIVWFSFFLIPASLLSLLCPFDSPLLFMIYCAEQTMNLIQWGDNFSFMLPLPKSSLIWTILSLIATAILLLPRGFGLHIWAVCVLGIFIFFPKHSLPENNLYATVYDVGQGTSVLLQTRNHALLFDTGRTFTANSLIQSLYHDNIKRLDTLILSHDDDDHDGVAEEIIEIFKPDNIFTGMPRSYQFANSHCKNGMTWQWDGVTFEFLTPTSVDDGENIQNGNDLSCVLRVIANDKAFLITGDLSSRYEQRLVEQYSDNLYSQVLLLGHHGSKTSTSSSFLNTVMPDYAIVSAGLNNGYFHPHPSVLKRLEDRNIAVFRTDYSGALRLNFNQHGINIFPAVSYRKYWQQKPFTDRYLLQNSNFQKQ